jgi:radical SAM superfamily enzyme YgiQ (UPF0313 family)
MQVLLVSPDRVGLARLGIMYLSSVLKSKGFQVSHCYASDGEEKLGKLIEHLRPAVLGYSIMSGEHPPVLELNRKLKSRYEFLAVFGGPHATFFPSIIDEPGCDAVCIGEGDLAFPEFCVRVQEGGKYWETPSFIARHEGRVYKNEIMPLVPTLDDLPDPDRDILYSQDKHLAEDRAKSFFSTRGCPYHCTYCFNSGFNTLNKGKGKIIRHRSPERLINEILEVKARYPLEVVSFSDDSFLVQPPGWFDAFCDLYKRKVGLPFTCNVRANLVREDLLSKLRDAGLSLVWMGVECGDETIANDVLQRQLSNRQIIVAARIIKKLGIKFYTQNLVGLPVQNSFEADLKTLDLNIEIKSDFAWSSILFPYPGTPISQYAQERGFIPSEGLKITSTNKRTSSLNFPEDEKRRIEHLHKLFGLLVEFPSLRPLAKRLCELPFPKLYLALFYIWYGYCHQVRSKNQKSLLKAIFRNAGLFVRMLRKD